MVHAEIEELLGAYALDAVDSHEADVIEAHLAGCPRCRAEVADFREAAAMLAHAGAQAPAGLWDRIAGSLEEPPPRLELARIGRPAPGSAWASRRVGMGLVAGIVSIAAAVISLLGVKVVQQDNRIAELAASMQRSGFEQEIAALAVAEDSLKIQLVSGDGTSEAQAVQNLPALSRDRAYQLWGQVGDKKVSLGVLGPNPATVPFQVTSPQLVALAITEETADGAEQPSNAPVVAGWVPGRKVSA
jgi:anti-sigma factor RsiW